VIVVRQFAKNAHGTPMLSFMYRYVRLVSCRIAMDFCVCDRVYMCVHVHASDIVVCVYILL